MAHTEDFFAIIATPEREPLRTGAPQIMEKSSAINGKDFWCKSVQWVSLNRVMSSQRFKIFSHLPSAKMPLVFATIIRMLPLRICVIRLRSTMMPNAT